MENFLVVDHLCAAYCYEESVIAYFLKWTNKKILYGSSFTCFYHYFTIEELLKESCLVFSLIDVNEGYCFDVGGFVLMSEDILDFEDEDDFKQILK